MQKYKIRGEYDMGQTDVEKAIRKIGKETFTISDIEDQLAELKIKGVTRASIQVSLGRMWHSWKKISVVPNLHMGRERIWRVLK